MGRKCIDAFGSGFPRKAAATYVMLHKGLDGPDRLESWDCSHLLPGSLHDLSHERKEAHRSHTETWLKCCYLKGVLRRAILYSLDVHQT